MRELVFNWNFYYACNYRCSYCYFDGRWEELARLNQRRPLEEVLAAWERVHARYGGAEIQFSGGEPTVYPRFDELLIGLSAWHRWSLNTNLSWDVGRWERIAARVDPARTCVYMSYHPTEQPDLARFIRDARRVRALGFQGSITVVAHPPLLDRLGSIVRELRESGLEPRPQPFVGRYQGRDYPGAYTPEEKALVRGLNAEGGSDLLPDLPYAIADESPLGKPCRAGQLYCNVSFSGDVYRCQQLESEGQRRLGNLFTGFELDAGPTPCPARFCSCGESRWLVEARP